MSRRSSRRARRRLCLILLFILLLLLAAWGLAEGVTAYLAAGRCAASPNSSGRVGLVLGCSPKLGKNRPNKYFTGRMDAAAELWQSGQLRGLIVSGDNSQPYYNEPGAMRAALIARGVPAERIVEDFAGICTYDSVYRARSVFGAEKLYIVSQDAHVRRAVAIAEHLGIDARGYAAALGACSRASRLRQYLRERVARIAMLFDFAVRRRPTFGGEARKLPF